ncbi:arginine/serine-rich coiled-coil protein 2 isoform X3 [Bactrocera oleae]|nr:arginine/serine-rich coiled-coil protein 2 isoform X3 [Bactrocera oleae]XP_036221384.1 arginine/serine-rich coiled-coil protein 2 isoform X3 [Bactrocera oleae]
MIGDGSRGGGKRGSPPARNSNYRDEDTQKQSSSFGSSKRPTSSTYHSRDNKRDNRDNRRESRDNVRDHREERESRDTRYSKDHTRYDYKNDRTRTRDYQNDHRRDRDNFDNRRPPRDDDRNRPSSSSYKNNRYGGNGRDERPRHDSSTIIAGPSSLRQQHHNRSLDQRHTEHYDHSTSRHRRRSNSRSPSPSTAQRHYHSKRSAHDEKSYSRHRSRSRSRSITPTRSDSREKDREGFALEKARLSAQAMERKIHTDSHSSQEKGIQSLHSSARTEALLSLPLNETAPKQPNVIAVAPVPSTSSNNGGEPAVIQLPSYYNPNVINPNKYAEQVQKRKLLWGAKKAEDTAAKWGNAQFSQDTDGKVASKFMRLMGIKGSGPSKSEEVVEQKVVPTVAPDVKTREVMFSNMEQQYEVARQATHTMRGVGLGFSSQARPF